MKRLPILAAALVLLPHAALAHPGSGAATGAGAGFFHPLGGADHVLAMVAVGLLAAIRRGRALWALPASFLALMAIGAGLGMAAGSPPFVEAGIAFSVVAFGLALTAGSRARLAPLAVLVGGFALFHGLSHGAEIPETASGIAYGLGFLAATSLLHAAGIGLGLAGARLGAHRTATALGVAVAAAGLALMALPA